MPKTARTEPSLRRQTHAVAVAATAAIHAAATRIAAGAREKEELKEEQFVKTLVGSRRLAAIGAEAAAKTLTETGFDDVELKVIGFGGKDREDCSVLLDAGGVVIEYPVNHKREEKSSGQSRLSRRNAMLQNTCGTESVRGQALSAQLVTSLTNTANTHGWGVVALVGPLGDVVVRSYDVPAVLATAESFNGLGGAITVPGFKASEFGATCAMYGAEDGVLQAAHGLAHRHWWMLAPKLARSRTTRGELALAAARRYSKARKLWLAAALAEETEIEESLDELSELRATGLITL